MTEGKYYEISKMRAALKSDKDLVVQMIAHAFDKNQGINWMLKLGKNHKKQIERLAAYAFYQALYSNGAYISSNEKGLALCYK